MAVKKIEYAPEKTGGAHPFPVKDVILKVSECYSNNVLIKRSQVNHAYTLEQAKEVLRCKNDVVYFLETYGRIISIDKGIVPFVLYDYQKEMLAAIIDNNFTIFNLFRQAGKTTLVAGCLLWYALFNDSKRIAILANKASQSQEVMDRVRLMFENLPFFLQQGVGIYNKQTVEFENSSRLFSAATSSSSIRGKSVSILYLDELAFVANSGEFFESTYPVITSGKDSRVIITSTPKGKRGLFYKLYNDAVNGNNAFKPLEFKWNRHHDRDENWKKETIANTSVSQFAQEFEVEFRGSVGTLIPSNILENLTFSNPLNDDEHLKVYEAYNKDRSYVAVADSAGGVGGDYSVLNVFDVTEIPYRQVAIYRNNEISPMLYPYTIHSICTQYGSCPVLVEGNNDMGGQVSYILYHEIEYPNVIMTKSETRGVQGTIIGGNNNTVPCVKTTRKVKSFGCSNLKTMLENGTLLLADETTIDELGTFVEKAGSYEADADAHDDCVMTLVLFAWLAKQPYFKDYANSDIGQYIFDRSKELREAELLPFGYIDDGTSVYDSFGLPPKRADYDGWL